MTDLRSVFVGALLVAAVLSIGVAVYALRNRRNRQDRLTTVLAVMMAVTCAWSVGSLGAHLSASATATWFWFGLINVATFALPVSWIVFAAHYANYDRHVTRRTIGLLAVVPALTFLTMVTNGFHGWFLADARFVSERALIAYTTGWVYDLHLIYAYILILAGIALIGHVAYTSRRVYRKQAIAIAAAVVVPLLANVHYVRMGGPESVNWTPVAFAITGVAIAAAIFRYRLLEIVPVARESVVETMRDGVIVLDEQRRIVDVNATAERMLEGPNPGADLIGASAKQVRLGTETVESIVETGRDELAIERAGTTQHVAIRSEPITTGSDATLVMIQDETYRREHERELERTNARLDEFASVVSHDLRNPLNIAAGYLDMLETSVDEDERETLDVIRTQHDRMQAIIDDALTLAREGSAVDETETLSLEAVAREAWDGVDTGAATLTVVDDRSLEADRNRLLRALENLFRNCVEHAGPTVSVAVGSSDEGFYVVDDGPGIPPDERERVFDSGYSTGTDGTGFGLSIVTQIADAHGWTVECSERGRNRDGACFEFSLRNSTDRLGPALAQKQ
ncbi:histidine kinase N-terminal 7TM domain-containing protein [Natronosalvus halobius]|uniref:sensor histidine kinase n=1 Tax=Natronosalvus halobius TaxID=2953746 RepID=UPI0020A08A7F|nr:histidine kinase N-terminal 7TM domain-containing protein [Natronosalvus halobius]USZ72560.1 ATP-binding protein [Natronosalvus halobius]